MAVTKTQASLTSRSLSGNVAKPDWATNNPTEAAKAFADRHPDFIVESPAFRFNEGAIERPVTYWPGAWLKRVAAAKATAD